MTIQTAGTSGPSSWHSRHLRRHRQRPDAPHIVEVQPRPGARWVFEAECKSPEAAQEWIWQKTRLGARDQEEPNQ